MQIKRATQTTRPVRKNPVRPQRNRPQPTRPTRDLDSCPPPSQKKQEVIIAPKKANQRRRQPLQASAPRTVEKKQPLAPEPTPVAPVVPVTSSKPTVYQQHQLDETQSRFAPWGTSLSFPLPNNRKLEHGTDPHLMEKACKLLGRDFEINGRKDSARYFRKSKYTYYAVVQSLRHSTTVDCAVRVILDDLVRPTVVVLDLIRTRSKHAGEGLASLLVNFVLEGCAALGANIYITSVKEARSYWARFGFVKETDEDVDYALNEFKDCTLLSLPTNKPLQLNDDDTSSSSDSSSDDSDSDSSEDSEEDDSYDDDEDEYSVTDSDLDSNNSLLDFSDLDDDYIYL